MKRVLLKLSGEALMGDKSSCKVLDKEITLAIANQVKQLVDNETQVCIVIGGGNIFRGKEASELGISKLNGDYMGMTATLFNSLAFKATLDAIDVDSVVMNALKVDKSICETYSKKKANKYLNNNKVVIFAYGTGKPGYTTDTCSALRACDVNVDTILVAKNGTNGVYDKDPNKYKTAKMYKSITHEEFIDKELGVIDLEAIKICKEHKINLFVFNMKSENAIINAVNGSLEGTLIGKE